MTVRTKSKKIIAILLLLATIVAQGQALKKPFLTARMSEQRRTKWRWNYREGKEVYVKTCIVGSGLWTLHNFAMNRALLSPFAFCRAACLTVVFSIWVSSLAASISFPNVDSVQRIARPLHGTTSGIFEILHVAAELIFLGLFDYLIFGQPVPTMSLWEYNFLHYKDGSPLRKRKKELDLFAKQYNSYPWWRELE